MSAGAFQFSRDAIGLALWGILLLFFWLTLAWGVRKIHRKWNPEKVLPQRCWVAGETRRPKRTLFLGVVLTILAMTLIAREAGANALLIPLTVAFLTIPIVPRMAALLIVTCCFGLGYLLFVGDSAIDYPILGNTARRLLWSASFLVLLVMPFLCAFRSLRIELSKTCVDGEKPVTQGNHSVPARAEN